MYILRKCLNFRYLLYKLFGAIASLLSFRWYLYVLFLCNLYRYLTHSKTVLLINYVNQIVKFIVNYVHKSTEIIKHEVIIIITIITIIVIIIIEPG